MDARSKQSSSRSDRLTKRRLEERLELIKRRHRQLILAPRQRLLDDLSLDVEEDYDDGLEINGVDATYKLEMR